MEEFMHVFHACLLGSEKGSECLTNEKYQQGLLEVHWHTQTECIYAHGTCNLTF